MSEKADKRAKRKSLPRALLNSVSESFGGGGGGGSSSNDASSMRKESSRSLMKRGSPTNSSSGGGGDSTTAVELSELSTRVAQAVRSSSTGDVQSGGGGSGRKKDKKDKKRDKRGSSSGGGGATKHASIEEGSEAPTTQSSTTATVVFTEIPLQQQQYEEEIHETLELSPPRRLIPERPRSASSALDRPAPLAQEQRMRLDSHAMCDGRLISHGSRLRALESEAKMTRETLIRLSGEVQTLHGIERSRQRIDIQERLAVERRDEEDDPPLLRFCCPCLL